MDLDLYVADESIVSNYLSRSFMREIIFEGHVKFKDFLNKEEEEIIRPNTAGEIYLGRKREATFFEKVKMPFILHKAMKGKITVEEINKLSDKLVHRSEKIEDRERDPEKLKEALKKTEQYLQEKSNELPLVHSVYKTENLKESVGTVMVNDVKAHIEGDLFYYDNYKEIRNKIHLKSYHEDFGKVDFFIDVAPKIEINQKTYFTKSITKAEQFAESFEDCYSFLEEVIKNNKKVLWEFG